MASTARHHATTEIHSGYSPAGPHRPMTVPIYNSAAFEFPDYATAAELFSLKKAGFTYSRTGNPTVAVLETRAAALEGGIGAIATATGQAAVAISLLALLQGPNHLVASNKLYGGTVDLLTDTFADFGITVTFVDPEDTAAWAAAITGKTRGFILESVSNPLITLVDLQAITVLAHAAGIRWSWTTPWPPRPPTGPSNSVPTSWCIRPPRRWPGTDRFLGDWSLTPAPSTSPMPPVGRRSRPPRPATTGIRCSNATAPTPT